MIPPTPGADPASRLFGYATPPDGAGPIGPDQLWPTPVKVSHEELMRGLNPLQHIPFVGMLYRAITGETIPTTMRVIGAAIVGGPLGAFSAGVTGLLGAIATMKPDLSRPAVPAGMSVTGSEAGIEPVTPGTLTGNSSTSLATTLPEWLAAPAAQAGATEPSRGAAAYRQVSVEWQRAQWLEKGLA